MEEIRLELRDLEEKANPQEAHDEVNQNPPKKRRLLGSLSDSDDEEVQNTESRAELANYQAERKLKGDACPFSLWRARRGSYLLTSKETQRYDDDCVLCDV